MRNVHASYTTQRDQRSTPPTWVYYSCVHRYSLPLIAVAVAIAIMYSPPPATVASNAYSHAVSRSSELLSCAKTALKVAKAQHATDRHGHGRRHAPSIEPPWYHADPQHLRLAPETADDSSPTIAVCQDALSFLRAMQSTLTTLQSLVRRRGHTNDPTSDIALATRTMEQDAQELAALVQSLTVTATTEAVSTQHARHLELVAAWLQAVASQQTSGLKQVLQVRGTVLADQAQRRKLLQPSAPRNGAASKVKTKPGQAAMNSPLFTMTAKTNKGAVKPVNAPTAPPATNGNGTTRTRTSAPPPLTPQNGHGGSSGYAGYGGYGGASYGATGMRQRRTAPTNHANHDDMMQVQSQIQERQAKRETQTRLEQAKQAESTLAELGTLFGKMTHLISAQGEQLEKLEDDVEAAMGDVTAGQEEIQTLYGIKKGNRGLILKVFGVLIFLILFMKLY